MRMLSFEEKLRLNVGKELAVYRRTEEETVFVSKLRSLIANKCSIKFSCFFYCVNAE